MLGEFVIPIVIGAVAVVVLAIGAVTAMNYRKAEPNEALILTGRKYKVKVRDADGSEREVSRGWRAVVGGGTVKFPVLERESRMSLELMNLKNVRVVAAYSAEGVPVTIDAVANVKVGSEAQMLALAVERFLSVPMDEIQMVIKETLEGQLRDIIGMLTVEELYQKREMFVERVLRQAGDELGKIGIQIDIINIQDIRDEQGYLNALGEKRTAEVKRDAEVGRALAEAETMQKAETAKREGLTVRAEQERQVKEADKDRDVAAAGYVGLTEASQAEAAQQGPIHDAKARQVLVVEEQKVVVAETEARKDVVQTEQAVLRVEQEEREKVQLARARAEAALKKADVVVPAEAAKEAAIVQADGSRQAVVLTADGAAEAVKREAAAEAERIKAVALAEADGIRAKGEAEAEVLERKAESYKKFEHAAILSLQLETLQAVAGAAATGLDKVTFDKIVAIDGGGSGAEGASGDHALVRMVQSGPKVITDFVEQIYAIHGVDLRDALKEELTRRVK